MKVTGRPSQNGFCDAPIETLTGRIGFTVIVMALDVAGLLLRQVVSEEVRTQVTTSPLTGIYDIVEVFGNTPPPLTFH